MQKIIDIFIGLPGSGKTHILNGWDANFVVVDNVYENYPANFNLTKSLMAEGINLAVSDVIFCRREKLEEFEKFIPADYHKRYFYFENNPMECKLNVVRRNSKNYIEQLKLIDKLTENYHPAKYSGCLITVYKYENKNPN